MSEERGDAVVGRLVGVVARRLMLLSEIPVKVLLSRAKLVAVVMMERAVLRFEERQASEGGMRHW